MKESVSASTRLDLDALAELARKATPGPWVVHAGRYEGSDYCYVTEGKSNLADDIDPHDAAYIAAANPTTVLTLIDMARLAALLPVRPMSKLTDDRLLPCPFCGCDDIGTESTATDGSVWCNGCRARITKKHYHPRLNIGQRDAIAAWNHRTALPSEKTEPVAWRHRVRVRQLPSTAAPWSDWSEWRDGKAPAQDDRTSGDYLESDDQPLYASPSPAGMKIKALEWKKLSEAKTADTYGCRFIAHCSFGEYFVNSSAYGHGWNFSRLGYAEIEADSEDAAKAAAQADYSQRILSALDPGEPK